MERQRIALVTGAAQGLGRACACKLHEAGFHVICVDRNEAGAQSTATAIGGEWRVCDVSDRDAVAAMAASVERLDALINNAGIWRYGSVLDQSDEDIDDVLRVNLMGTLWCTRALVPRMSEGGAIVNFSSIAATMHAVTVGIYSASKAAIETLTKQLAVELGPRGIRVNAVAPGLILTEGSSPAYAGERLGQRARTVPLGTIGDPEDIANAVAYLVSPEARYVSGLILTVDGAASAGQPLR